MTKLKLNIAGTEVEYEGNEKFLETKVLLLQKAFKKSYNDEVKRNLLEVHEDLQQNLATLESYSGSMSRLNEELARKTKEFSDKLMNFLESIKTCASSQADLFAATKEMQEMQMSFNLQYLHLQNQMQYENQKFTTMSNIMKSKHDTAKSSIKNIR